MKFGLWTVNMGEWGFPANAKHLATTAESLGFESLWTGEHVVIPRDYTSDNPTPGGGKMPFPDDYPFMDSLVYLSWVAAHTKRIRLCTGVVALPLRNAVLTAKELATLDVLSGGRLTFGIGLGWMPEEFAALSVPFEERVPIVEDAIETLRSLWSGTHATHHGRYWSFTNTACSPQPVQEGGVPIFVSGSSPAAARRAGRVGDGWLPMLLDPTALEERLADMHAAAEKAGRNPEDVEITLGMAPVDPFAADLVEHIGCYEKLGVSRIIVPPLCLEPAHFSDWAERFAADVIAPFANGYSLEEPTES